jgi:hypothetical protein
VGSFSATLQLKGTRAMGRDIWEPSDMASAYYSNFEKRLVLRGYMRQQSLGCDSFH